MSELDLRSATLADAPALASLGRNSFVAKFGHLYRPEDLAAFLAENHAEPVVARDLADPAMRVMLATRDDRLLGYCRLVLECGWPEHARGSRAIELRHLYTAPGVTGQGIGAALLDWALAEAASEGADEVQLSVWSGNHDAQRFYRRHGFEHVADIDFWVGAQRDDEFLFARLL
jgi:ribosomal protein S18 acetylase RimI-like enzyme